MIVLILVVILVLIVFILVVILVLVVLILVVVLVLIVFILVFILVLVLLVLLVFEQFLGQSEVVPGFFVGGLAVQSVFVQFYGFRVVLFVHFDPAEVV